MNTVNLIGRLTKDPDISFININGESKKIAKYVLAVDRMGSKEADFILCSVIDKGAEWIENNVKKASRIGIVGSIHTSTYEKNGVSVIKTEIKVKEQYFA